ncbi:MAG: DNA-binding response regulator [Phycisphaerales bacterium]|nr:MAG: DNA-binding response regulator [Phycisphaerales bacterium]
MSNTTTTEATTIIIVDDHAMMLGGIRSILEGVEGLSVVAEATNGRDAIALASKHAPDIMFIDVGMPDLNGIEATRKIHTADPKIAIIALSMHSDERYVTGMLDAGARGYLLKTCDSEELFRAIDSVKRGKFYVTSDLTHVLVDRRQGSEHGVPRTGTPPIDSLTPREREVLQLIAEGLTSKEIGVRIGAALKTIESHRTNIIRKLDIHSIAELTKYAVREGLTGLSE